MSNRYLCKAKDKDDGKWYEGYRGCRQYFWQSGNVGGGRMKWKHKTVTELTGGSLSGNLVVVARAVNNNAYTLKEAVQKIEELSKEIEQLKKGEADER